MTNKPRADAYRDALVRYSKEAHDSFDRTLVVLSGGALLGSMTFVKDLAPKPSYVLLLFSSWFAFAASLILILLSLLWGGRAIAREIEIYDINEPNVVVTNVYRTLTGACNWSSLILFAVGVVFFGVFAAVNLE